MNENQNGNGNGSANGKIFTLQPVGEDLNSVAPQLRGKVCCNARLTTGARMLYCYLSDQSFLRSVNQGVMGTVTKGKGKIGRELGVNERTVRRWARELEEVRFVWTRVYWHAGFELTTWYLRNMADEQQELWKDADPRYGRSRAAESHQRDAVRGENGQFCPNTEETAKTTVLPQKSAVNGHKSPVTTDNPDRGQRTAVSVVHGQSCPLTADNPDRGQRTSVTVVNGHSRPSTADNFGRGQRTGVSEFKETPDDKGVSGEDPFKRSTGFNARNGSGGAKKISLENYFLARVGVMMENWKKGSSKAELANSGAWWRMSYRANPDLVQRVLSEVQVMVRENKIRESPGQTAVDLWKRWSLPILKQKTAARTAAR